MLKISNIEKSFAKNHVLKGVSFEISSGEIVGLVGPSGGGKSVLLKILGEVLTPDKGEVALSHGESDDSEVSLSDVSVGFSFQEGALFDSQSVLDNVAFPLTVYKKHLNLSKEEIYSKAFDVLDQVGLSAAASKFPGQLSGGMRRRVGIARALVSKPDVVLLDDPTGGLDPVAASVVMNLIRDLHSHYKPTVLLVSHDIRRLLPAVNRILGLFDGIVICDLPPEDLKEKAEKEVVDFLSTRYDFN